VTFFQTCSLMKPITCIDRITSATTARRRSRFCCRSWNRGARIWWCILAGYGDRMDKFFASNPGFRSRIAHHVDFPDYADEELLAIAELMLRDMNYKFTPDAWDAFVRYISLRKCVGF
jgi:hypothetical protein